MALSHVKIKWTKSDTPWVCRVEYYRPKTTWKRYRGADTKCEKPNYTIYDPCYALTPPITGKIKIIGANTNIQKFAGREGSGNSWCPDQNQLYVQLLSAVAAPSVNKYFYFEHNAFKRYSGDDIQLSRGQRIWSWYADPAAAIDYENVIGVETTLGFYIINRNISLSSAIAKITGMGFNTSVTSRCNLWWGNCIYYQDIKNYDFTCTPGTTYQITVEADDWLMPENPHVCETLQHNYTQQHTLGNNGPTYLILGEKGTWEGSWDPPLEGEYMLGVKNEAGEFFPICPIVDSQ